MPLPVRLLLLAPPSSPPGTPPQPYLCTLLPPLAIPLLRSLDPTHHEPLVSSALLRLASSPSRPLPQPQPQPQPEDAAGRPPSVDLDGLAPFADAWLPLSLARTLAASLGWERELCAPGGVLGWGRRRMASWVERGSASADAEHVLVHNWRPSPSILASQHYCLSALLALPDLNLSTVVLVGENSVLRTPLPSPAAPSQTTSSAAPLAFQPEPDFPLPSACQRPWFAYVRLAALVGASTPSSTAAATDGGHARAAHDDDEGAVGDDELDERVVGHLLSDLFAALPPAPSPSSSSPSAAPASNAATADLVILVRSARRTGLGRAHAREAVGWVGEVLGGWVRARVSEARERAGRSPAPLTAVPEEKDGSGAVGKEGGKRGEEKAVDVLGTKMEGLGERLASVERALEGLRRAGETAASAAAAAAAAGGRQVDDGTGGGTDDRQPGPSRAPPTSSPHGSRKRRSPARRRSSARSSSLARADRAPPPSSPSSSSSSSARQRHAPDPPSPVPTSTPALAPATHARPSPPASARTLGLSLALNAFLFGLLLLLVTRGRGVDPWRRPSAQRSTADNRPHAFTPPVGDAPSAPADDVRRLLARLRDAPYEGVDDSGGGHALAADFAHAEEMRANRARVGALLDRLRAEEAGGGEGDGGGGGGGLGGSRG